jgi:uncharacterized protein (TIGR02145 family)
MVVRASQPPCSQGVGWWKKTNGKRRKEMKTTIAMLLLFCAAVFAQQKGTFTDPRDKKTYKTVKIGDQIWMAENLNYAIKGSKCGGTTTRTEACDNCCDECDPEECGTTCTYYLLEDKNTVNCNKYGRLYNWNTAMKACPSGWHLPSDEEWTTLTDFVGSNTETKLKSASGWKIGNGTDEFGFSALPGGHGNSGGDFGNVGFFGNWWSSTERNASNAYYRSMHFDNANVGRSNIGKTLLFSVRCVQD